MGNIKKYVDYVVEGIAVIAFSGMCIAILIQVFARYIFKYPTPWAEELSRFLNAWAVFLAAAWAVNKGTHITIRAIVDRLPRKWQQWISLLIDIIVSILLAAVFWGSITMMKSSHNMLSGGLQLRMTYFYLALCIGSIAMIFYYLIQIIAAIKVISHQKKSQGKTHSYV